MLVPTCRRPHLIATKARRGIMRMNLLSLVCPKCKSEVPLNLLLTRRPQGGLAQNFTKHQARTRLDRFTDWETMAKHADYSGKQLAELCGCGRRTLQNYILKNFNLSLEKWLMSVRLRDAVPRLLAGACVKEVAFDLGFKQASHFSRVFKKAYGISPLGFISQTNAVNTSRNSLSSSFRDKSVRK